MSEIRETARLTVEPEHLWNDGHGGNYVPLPTIVDIFGSQTPAIVSVERYESPQRSVKVAARSSFSLHGASLNRIH